MIGRVVVVGPLEALGDLVLADAGRDGEGADVVGNAALARRDEIGQRDIGAALALRRAAGAACAARRSAASRVSSANSTMSSPSALAGQKPTTALRAAASCSPTMRSQHRLRVGEQLARRGAVLRVVEDRRIVAGQLPGLEERRPVDVVDQLGERIIRRTPACRETLGCGG